MSRQILCCFKLKSATLFIGILDLMFHLIIMISLLSSMQRFEHIDFDHAFISSQHHPPLTYQFSIQSGGDIAARPMSVSETSLKNLNNENKLANELWFNSIYSIRNKQNRPIGLLVTVCSTFIILMHIYGIMKNKPSYLMPYFSIKVFQVVLLCLTTLGFYSSLPNLKKLIEHNKYLAFKESLLKMDRQQLELVTFGVLLISILIKMYEVVIVWYCYRYMVTMEAFNNLRLMSSTPNANTCIPELGYLGIENLKDEDGAFLVHPPPKYDDIVKRDGAVAAAGGSSRGASGPSTSSAADMTSPPPPPPISLNTVNEVNNGENVREQSEEILPLHPPEYKSVVNSTHVV